MNGVWAFTCSGKVRQCKGMRTTMEMTHMTTEP